MTTTQHDSPIDRARALAVAIAEMHDIDNLTAFINQPATEEMNDQRSPIIAVFDAMYHASQELAVEFSCDVELLRRDVPTIRDEHQHRTAEHSILLTAAFLADRASGSDEERARDLMRRAFLHHYIPTDPRGWAPRHARRALELLDDADAVAWARADVEEVFARWSASDDVPGFDYVQVDIDAVRATLRSYVPEAMSML